MLSIPPSSEHATPSAISPLSEVLVTDGAVTLIWPYIWFPAMLSVDENSMTPAWSFATPIVPLSFLIFNIAPIWLSISLLTFNR